MTKRFRDILIIVLLSVAGGKAQHFQFSQFYAAPSYLNPAFTGANVCSRFALNYRSQWMRLPGSFNTYQVTWDHYARQMRSGIGLQFFSDVSGASALRTTQVNALYATQTQLSKNYFARAGVSVGTVSRRVDFGSLVFGDQIARDRASTSVENAAAGGVTYLDIGAGLLLFGRSEWLGISMSHINKPNQSLLNGYTELPTELKVHGGYKFVIEESETNSKIPVNHSVTFAFNYKRQLRFNQIDLGIYYNKDLIVIGFWYRGVPIYRPVRFYENNDALIFLVGINVGKYKIGYSFDYTVSTLNIARTAGSHEISMSYQLCKLKKAKRKKAGLISCPKF